jgi:hypothetical protein
MIIKWVMLNPGNKKHTAADNTKLVIKCLQVLLKLGLIKETKLTIIVITIAAITEKNVPLLNWTGELTRPLPIATNPSPDPLSIIWSLVARITPINRKINPTIHSGPLKNSGTVC